VFDAVSSAEFCELSDASSCGIELGSSVDEDLCGFAVLFDAFFQKLDGMLGCWVVVDPGAWYEA